MARNTKPIIKLAPGHKPNDRVESIYEFSAVVEGILIGGLLALCHMPDGSLKLDIYRTDPGLTITLPGTASRPWPHPLPSRRPDQHPATVTI